MKKRVVLGLSGGVDSAVAAYLLKQQGYEVIGVFMRNWDSQLNNDILGNPTNDNDICPQEQDYNDAKAVAKHLGIEIRRVDFIKEYWDKVFTYFIDEYAKGRTPNPDILCNKHIKFKAFLEYAEELNADFIATGHYARIAKLPNGRFAIRNSVTARKDQTYALYNLTQFQLTHTLMPIGEYEKDQVRRIAQEAGLPVAAKPDSQDICFVPDGDYAAFLKKKAGERMPGEGDFVTRDGTVLGKHKGITHYTIGQRKGLGLSMGEPVFVSELRPKTNQVVVGEEPQVFKKELLCDHLNFMGMEDLKEPRRVWAKVRYAHKGQWCRIERQGRDLIRAEFEEPVRAITPGQAVVFYEGEYVLGGGIIC